MKLTAIVLVAATFAAGAVSAAEKVTDVDYLRASRCKGLATTLNDVVDPASIAAFMKANRGTRASYVLERGEREFDRARREAKSEDRRGRVTAELTGACQAYLDTGNNTTKQ